VHDTILCSEAGLPSAVVITKPFQTMAAQTVRNLGVAEFASAVIDHPVWSRSDDWIESTAAKVADRVQALLFSGAR
jgi:hypothetical protein